jgi:hypothetical protein
MGEGTERRGQTPTRADMSMFLTEGSFLHFSCCPISFERESKENGFVAPLPLLEEGIE